MKTNSHSTGSQHKNTSKQQQRSQTSSHVGAASAQYDALSLSTQVSIPLSSTRADTRCQNEDVRISEDAGRYICEYQLYASLAHMSHVGNGKLPWKERTTVAFMHVPKCAAAGVEKLERSREVAIGLIYSLIDSRRSRDGDYDPGDNEEVPG